VQALVSKRVLHRILVEHGAMFEARLAESIARMLGLSSDLEVRRDSISIFKFIDPEHGTANFWRHLAAAVVIARNTKGWLARRRQQRYGGNGCRGGEGSVLGPSMSLLALAPAEAEALQRLTVAAPQRRRGVPGQDAVCQTDTRDDDIQKPFAAVGGSRDVEQLGLSTKAALAGSFKSGYSGVSLLRSVESTSSAVCDTATSIGTELVGVGKQGAAATIDAYKLAPGAAEPQVQSTGKKPAIASSSRPKAKETGVAASTGIKAPAMAPRPYGSSLVFGADDDELLIRQELLSP
jgi:hypothetical protein